MARLTLLLRSLMEFFKFLERRRLRREEALRAAHARQLELLDLALRRVVDAVREQQQPLMKALEAQQASTEVIASWLKAFQPAPAGAGEPTAPLTDVTNPALEWVEDIAAEEGEELPPEFRLALLLKQEDERAEPF
jgi:hypothetical protein